MPRSYKLLRITKTLAATLLCFLLLDLCFGINPFRPVWKDWRARTIIQLVREQKLQPHGQGIVDLPFWAASLSYGGKIRVTWKSGDLFYVYFVNYIDPGIYEEGWIYSSHSLIPQDLTPPSSKYYLGDIEINNVSGSQSVRVKEKIDEHWLAVYYSTSY